MSGRKRRAQITVSEDDLLFMKMRGFTPSGLLAWAVNVQREILLSNKQIIKKEITKVEMQRGRPPISQ